MAFVINWNEYQKHQLGKEIIFRSSLKIALVTFIFFILLSVVFGYIVIKKFS